MEVVVETPAKSRNKYEFDETAGRLRLDRQLPTGLTYPADYGFIPQTCADDGDPLDALVLVDEPVVPGSIVRVHAVGALSMLDGGRRDHKIIGVLPVGADDRRDLGDIPEGRLREIEHFFSVYKDLEPGVETQTFGYLERSEAVGMIEEARRRFVSGASSPR